MRPSSPTAAVDLGGSELKRVTMTDILMGPSEMPPVA
jgi:hypothetical protein